MRRSVAKGRVAAIVVATALAAGCGAGNGRPQPATTASPQPAPATLDVVSVIERPVSVSLDMPGELEPFEDVAIYPRVTGYVKSIGVDRGSRVRAGQVLAQLDAPELLAQRAEAESKLQAADAQRGVAQAKADADASTLDKLKAASATPGVVAGNDLVLAQKSLDADRSQIAAAEKNVDAARQALNSITQMQAYLTVTAPFDGVVTERNVHPGALVGPNASSGSAGPILRVVNTARLRLVVAVPEAYLDGVTQGIEMPFTVPAYPGETFTGTLARIAQAVDVKTRTMAVELDVQNRDDRLTPGSFCQVRWTIRRHGPSLLVPSGSVASTTGRTFVIRVRDGKTDWVDVKTGLATGRLVEVFGDLRPGDQIAVRGSDEIRPGVSVHAKQVVEEQGA